MPELRCGVITCDHNNQNYCDLDKIEVVGSSAKESEQTSCGSFAGRNGEQFTNSIKDATERSEVNCQACECEYNKSYECHAGRINVMGSEANRIEETECATFKKGK